MQETKVLEEGRRIAEERRKDGRRVQEENEATATTMGGSNMYVQEKKILK